MSFMKRSFVQSVLLVIALVAVRALFILIKPAEAVSIDIRYWEEVVSHLFQMPPSNPYLNTTRLNHPPFWFVVLFFLGKLSIFFGTQLQFAVQVLLIAVESIIALVLFQICKVPLRVMIFGVVLNPIAILLVCQHLNFDPFVGLWVLLFTLTLLHFYHSGDRESWLCSSLFLGLGMLTKTVPVVLLPFLAIRSISLRRSTVFLGAVLLFLPLTVGMGIIFALGEEGVLRNVIQYRSIPALIGISGINFFLSPQHAALFEKIHGQFFFVLLLSVLIGLSKRIREAKGISKESLVLCIAGMLCFIPTFGPGYGPQYVFWYLPLLVFLYSIGSPTIRTLLTSGYFIGTMTYVLDYSVVKNYGALAVRLDPSPQILSFSETLNVPFYGYLVHIPLYVWYLTFIGYAAFRAWRLR